jgi:hypothetical protein
VVGPCPSRLGHRQLSKGKNGPTIRPPGRTSSSKMEAAGTRVLIRPPYRDSLRREALSLPTSLPTPNLGPYGLQTVSFGRSYAAPPPWPRRSPRPRRGWGHASAPVNTSWVVVYTFVGCVNGPSHVRRRSDHRAVPCWSAVASPRPAVSASSAGTRIMQTARNAALTSHRPHQCNGARLR